MNMEIPSIESVKTKAQARILAMQWQAWQSEQSLSYGELALWQEFFSKVGEKFDIAEEFKENGIA